MRLKLFIVWTQAKTADIFYFSAQSYGAEAGTGIDMTLEFNTSIVIKPHQYL